MFKCSNSKSLVVLLQCKICMAVGPPRMHQNCIGYCHAICNFAATAPNQISLREGDRIAIISKSAEGHGWWKGRQGTQVSRTITINQWNHIYNYLASVSVNKPRLDLAYIHVLLAASPRAGVLLGD